MCMKNIIEINDFNAPELDIYARKSEVQLRRYNEPFPGLLLQKVRRCGPCVQQQAMNRFHFWSSIRILRARRKNFWHVFRRPLYIQQNMKSL